MLKTTLEIGGICQNTNCCCIVFINLSNFSYILVDLLRTSGLEVIIFRNTIEINYLEKILAKDVENFAFVLSPGPGKPSEAGNLTSIINHFRGTYPMIGICLGHQAIVECLGGTIGKSKHVVHGKHSLMKTSDHPLFNGLNKNEPVARYHSLIATSVPDEVEILATVDKIPMIIYCKDEKLIGFQFHPESILTLNGAKMLKNSLDLLRRGDHV